MSLLSKFIDSLHIHFHRAGYYEVDKPFAIEGSIGKNNTVVLLHKGSMVAGQEQTCVQQDSFYFFPAGQPVHVNHGHAPCTHLDEEYDSEALHAAGHLKKVSGLSDLTGKKEVVVSVVFDVLLYDVIPFFEILGVPPFSLSSDTEFGHLIRYIALEYEQQKLGRDKIIKNYMEEIIIQMCRYMDSQPQYKNFVEKLEYLTDHRLVDMVRHIGNHLDEELSNKMLAGIACVSEDYVGPFFKSLTGKNLQDYIEQQRLERAMFLLQTRPDNIQEIAHAVGFKDAAYFSRRFKLHYGQNAIKFRKRRMKE
jgi:AraC-like DNA-binding protein